MGFRSELDATRERADAAERELAAARGELEAHAVRIAEVDDLEVHLAGARHRLRALDAANKRRDRALVAAFFVAALGVGTAGVLAARDGSSYVRDASAEERRSRETARRERDRIDDLVAGHERDDALVRARSDLGLLAALASADAIGSGLELGRVAAIRGDAPATVGDDCRLVLLSGYDRCGAELRCGERVVHSLACRDAPPVDAFRAGDGVDVWHHTADWVVRIRRPGTAATERMPGGDALIAD